jgi:hypothetical protein
MKTLMLIATLVVGVQAAEARGPAKRSWQSLASTEQRQLKLFWGLPGMMAQERFNKASTAEQLAALEKAQKPVDELTRPVADLP